jgi:ribokinase
VSQALRVAVVGHIEWVTFAQVAKLPNPGDIVHSDADWDEAAGGGAVAAAELARLAGQCDFWTLLGNDEAANKSVEDLNRLHVTVHAARRPVPQTRAFTFLQPGGERTITVLGSGLKPQGGEGPDWEQLSQCDAVYFASGDAQALRHACKARCVVSTARILPIIRETGIVLDALVHSSADEGERYEEGMLPVAPRIVVTTEGSRGGRFKSSQGEVGRYEAVPLPGPMTDAYGAGDSFAAGLTYGLGKGLSLKEALHIAARSGAQAFCRKGALGV